MSPMWMVYAVAVAVALGAAAYLVESALRASGRPGRWAWAGALAGSWVLPALAWARPAPLPGSSAGGGPVGIPVEAAVTGTAGAGWGAAVAAVEPWVPLLWAASALLAVGLLGGAVARLRLRARRWPRARVAGTPVRLSGSFGPALLGVLRPEIVLPRWIVELDARERELVLRHEEEHARARDTVLLAGGALAAALMPWNPALWWQLRRLRQAVELDCDARVVGRDPSSTTAYGRLLLRVGERLGRVELPAAALSGGPPLLLRRIRSLTERAGDGRSRASRAAAAAAAVGGLLMVAVACETPAPTRPAPEADATPPAEIREGASASAAGEAAGAFRFRGDETGSARPDVYVDDVLIEDHGALNELAPEAIERIEVLKGSAAPGPRGAIYIYTREGSGHKPAGELRVWNRSRDGGG